MLYLITETYQQADYWCRFVADPPINPRDRALLILPTSSPSIEQKLRGYRITDEDEVVYYGPYSDGKYYLEVAREIRICRL